MFCLNLHRDLDPDPRGLEANELNMVGQLPPVRMVIALVFFKRLFTRSLSMDQAHGLIIGEYATCWSARTCTGVVVRLFCDTNPRSGVAWW
jgi:hypothetical protein